MEIPIINVEQIIEGVTASIFFPITIILFKKFDKQDFFLYSFFAWITTWVFRKLFVNIYIFYLKQNKIQDTTFYLYI